MGDSIRTKRNRGNTTGEKRLIEPGREKKNEISLGTDPKKQKRLVNKGGTQERRPTWVKGVTWS